MAWQRYFTFNQIEYPDEMLAAIVCREMGWTYEQFLNQPIWFIKNLLAYFSEEAQHIKRSQRG